MYTFSRITIFFFIAFTFFFSQSVSAHPVPDSDLSICYDDLGDVTDCAVTNQDGSFQINQMSFTKIDSSGSELEDTSTEWATVRDNVTRLVWEKKTDSNKTTAYRWDEDSTSDPYVAAYINDLNSSSYGGRTDWRLPSIDELCELGTNLTDETGMPKIDIDYFPDTQTEGGMLGGFYWSSSPNNTTTFLCFSFKDFSIFLAGKVNQNPAFIANPYIRAVCGAPRPGVSKFTKNGNRTVTDSATGLMWEVEPEDKYTGDIAFNRTEAITYCTGLGYGGYSDWRLPTAKEIMSIAEFTSADGEIAYLEIFPYTRAALGAGNYWTSSWIRTSGSDPFSGAASTPVSMNFSSDALSSMMVNSDNTKSVIAVRGGQQERAENLFITSPRQAGELENGETATITWMNPAPVIPGNVSISISTDGGLTFSEIIASTENDGSFDWDIDSSINSVNCVLKINPLEDGYTSLGTSVGLFRIQNLLRINLTHPLLGTAEDGTAVTFEVSLNTTPDGKVVLTIISDNPDEGAVQTPALTFTTENWKTPQAVFLTGVDDNIADGIVTYHAVIYINEAVTMDTTGYKDLSSSKLTFTNADDDTAGVIASETNGDISESGESATFTVQLGSEPSGKVVLALFNPLSEEATLNRTSIEFSTANWDQAQTVTVTGVADGKPDIDKTFNIGIRPTPESTDDETGYKDLASEFVSITNRNIDPGLLLKYYENEGYNYLNISEEGGTAKFSIRLNLSPDANVVLDVTCRDETEGTVSPEKLTFTRENWAIEQFVTIIGMDDYEIDGLQEFETDVTVNQNETADTTGFRDASGVVVLKIRNEDDNDWENLGFTVSEVSGEINEEGGIATFKIKLNTVPDDDVIINITSLDETEGTISPSSLIFTPSTWNIDQTLTVTGVADNEEDGEKDFIVEVEVSSATTDTTGYDGVSKTQLTLTNKGIPTNAGDSVDSGGDSSGSCFIGSVK